MFYTNVFQRGSNLYVSGVDKGLPFKKKIKYKPYIFLPNENGEYRTLFGEAVTKKHFNSMGDARDFTKTYSEVNNFEYYGLTNFPYLFIYDNFPGKIEYDMDKISIMNIDIETSLYSEEGKKKFPNLQLADHQLTAITITKNNKSATFGCGEYTSNTKGQYYIQCDDERDMILKFIETWSSSAWMPDILTGWNINQFDCPFLFNRIVRLFSKETLQRLSPWKMVQEKRFINKGIEITYFAPVGVSFLDYIELYKKFTFNPRESYALNFIASEELGLKKLDYSAFQNLEELYHKDYKTFIEYNIRDCFLVDRLEDKLKLIKLVVTLSYIYKCNFEDTLGTVKPWDMFIHHYLLDKKIVIPQYKAPVVDRTIVGGWVKDPTPARYNWIIGIDVKSSYPHQIISKNISPETFITKIKDYEYTVDEIIRDQYKKHKDFILKNNYSVAGNLCCFTKKKKGFMVEIMEMMFAQRAEYQKQLQHYKNLKDNENTNKHDNLISEYDVWQLAFKIAINAFYGMMANEYCRWFSLDLAEAITMSGQETIKWIEYKINLLLNRLCKTEGKDYIIAIDTDSNYICLEKLLKNYNFEMNDIEGCRTTVDEFCKTILEPYIKKSFDELHVISNSYQNKIRMSREIIAASAIWRGKKNYILNLVNKDGKNFDTPKLKMVGLETVKSSTPAIIRKSLTDCFKIVMNGKNDELIKYVSDFKQKYYTLNFEDIASPRGVNGMEKYAPDSDETLDWKLRTPIHVKGSHLFNKLLKKHNMNHIVPISSGDKIRYIYLTVPNPTKQSVIAAPNFLPKEFNLDQYIDRETQYNKTFLEPLKSITSVNGWKVDKTKTLFELVNS